jgi:hypothetical protein
VLFRSNNFEYVKEGNKPILPKDCKAVRIHASGDFFNQEYFNMWIEIANENPTVEFWAYTKSLKYWVNKLNEIPKNLTLTASYGGRNDELIKEYNLKHSIVIKEKKEDLPIDYNDDYARMKDVNFYLLDNFKK